ncbi:glucose-6-phosphate dehydrogenase [Gordonia aquimaris]|jgi:glucose-6-phosphate 1-dehydrogenase|uniref:Glucose-6-phosphate dehydrogenase n=1 Tax=Gordonia aquimaris TaxID=2984863 RepID=A0A9X3D874_9ACTN|nr:glucose-6-phosphate dehydrogenase [Gordonia aquimaris]MCX2965764.1 glucose-6-phosphate dehydrogenase [Gordonia aquimaris]
MATTTLFIFGAMGDLTSRLLLPALAQLLALEPDRSVRLVGVGRRDVSDDEWRERVSAAFGDDVASATRQVADQTTFLQADVGTADGMRTVLDQAGDGRSVLYFAVPPSVAQQSCDAMAELDDLPDGLMLALEKPFGTDDDSARDFNAKLARLVPENQVFRVDHFLGQSILLDLFGIRFANRVFEPVWSAEHIESVVIRYDETLGLEGRAGYYDKAGALVDMMQSHLLELLAVVAMDPPASLNERDLRDATGAALRATRVMDGDPVRSSRRARYTSGQVDGKHLPSYVDEDGVDPTRDTETLAEATFEVNTARWAGVPFTLRSGKALEPAVKEIALHFRPVRHLPQQFSGDVAPNVLRLTFGPDAMSLRLNVHDGTDPFDLAATELGADLGEGSIRAYAEVLSGILDGDATLAVRGDAAEQCWRIVGPIIDAWQADRVPLEEYPAGSAGPEGWPSV